MIGVMAAAVREFQWETTPLGPQADWPDSLATTVGIVLNAQMPMILWWGEWRTQIHNDAFSRAFASANPAELLGRGPEAWPEMWSMVGADVERVMAGHGAVHRQDQQLVFPGTGQAIETFWSYDLCPIAGDGGVAGVLAIGTDVTQQHVDAARSRALSSGLLQLFQEGPDFVAVLRGPDHVYQFVNDHYRALMGDRDFIGRAVREVVPEVADQGFFELLDAVFRTGRPFKSSAIPMRYHQTPDAPMKEVVLELSYQAIVGPDGKTFGIYVDGHPVGDAPGSAEAADALDARLSERETEVIRWTAAGKTAAEIATILDISGRTVEFHITSAARKLDTVNRVHTVVEAIRKNLIEI